MKRALLVHQPEDAEDAIRTIERCSRLGDAKLLRAECALGEYYLDCGDIEKAEERLLLLRDRAAKSSWSFFQSTILLIVVTIRKGERKVLEAELKRFFNNLSRYKTTGKRQEFLADLIHRLSVETLMAGVRDQPPATECGREIIDCVITATRTFSMEQLLVEIGSAVPKNHLNTALALSRNAVLALPQRERGSLLDD